MCSLPHLQNDTVTVRTRKFMTNRLLQRKQMVRLQTLLNCWSSLSHPSGFLLKHALCAGRRCPASRQGYSPQDWNQGETCQDVQDHSWCRLRLWLQDSVWWRQDNRLCHGVRFPWLCQEEWAQTQTGQGEFWSMITLIADSLTCKLIWVWFPPIILNLTTLNTYVYILDLKCGIEWVVLACLCCSGS